MRMTLLFILAVTSLECAVAADIPVYLCTKYDGTKLYINTGGLKGFKGCDLVDLSSIGDIKQDESSPLQLKTLLPKPWKWAKVADETDDLPARFMDRASLAIAGSQRKAWILETSVHTVINALTGVGSNSSKSLYMFRCSDRSFGEVQRISYVSQLGEGAITEKWSSGKNMPEFNEVVPETVGEETFRFVCSYKK